jgi:hypothetical protein
MICPGKGTPSDSTRAENALEIRPSITPREQPEAHRTLCVLFPVETARYYHRLFGRA